MWQYTGRIILRKGFHFGAIDTRDRTDGDALFTVIIFDKI